MNALFNFVALASVLVSSGCQSHKPESIPTTNTGAMDGFRNTYAVDRSRLSATGNHPYFPLEPGTVRIYRDNEETLTITVLHETRVVDNVTTRIIEEREETSMGLKEISRNFFASDPATGDLYYFGEEVDIYKNGSIDNHGGAWLSGSSGARFGLMMPGKILVGDRFYQEVAPGIAMDRCEIVSTDERLVTPAGVFEHCVHIKETTPLEKDIGHKWYAPGVGLVKDGDMVLAQPPR